MIRWGECRREPFRLLFPLGVLFGCVGVSHWLWYALGWANASRFYHASIQIGAYMICFIAGFLWTAMPRMTATPPSTTIELSTLLGLLAAQMLCLALNRPVAAQGCFLLLLMWLAVFAVRRVLARGPAPKASAPIEFVWVPIGVFFGVVGAALAACAQAQLIPFSWMAAGRPMAQQGFVLAVVLGVGGFLGPRLLGRGFEWSSAITPERARHSRRRRLLCHLLAAGMIAASFLIEGAGQVTPAYALRAAVVSAELCWTVQLHRPPAVSDYYVRLLWMSLWMVALGFWAAAGFPRYRIAMLHLVFLGGFSLMTFAVGTMVVFSHAGQAQALRQPLGGLRLVAIGVAGSMVMRVLADLWPAAYFPSLALASLCWLIAGISWLTMVLPRVLTPLPAGEVDRVHEDARSRLMRGADQPRSQPCSRPSTA